MLAFDISSISEVFDFLEVKGNAPQHCIITGESNSLKTTNPGFGTFNNKKKPNVVPSIWRLHNKQFKATKFALCYVPFAKKTKKKLALCNTILSASAQGGRHILSGVVVYWDLISAQPQ